MGSHSRGGKMMRFKTYSSVLFLVALVSMSVDAARAHGDHATCISGREWFKGVEIGEITFGTIHAGWTTAEPNSSAEDGDCIAAGWQPVGNTDGGEFHDRLRRTGDSGLGGMVTILGGKWSWEQADSTHHQGRIRQELDGQLSTVVWPETLDEDIGCGAA
jgi:hypothetical protein